MSKTKEDRLAEVHEEALREFNRAYDPQQEVRLQCLEDRRFVSVPGAQWQEGLAKQFENRPRFEVNKIHMSVMRIFNEYRNNRITVDFRPIDDGASDETADALDGLYRADERECNAQEAYDNCFDEGVSGGFGAWRLRADYEDEEDEDDDRQRIKIEPIYDADSSVFFDADAKRQDKSDATRCWVIYSISHSAYEQEYGAIPSSFPKEGALVEFDWFTPDVCYLAEYYKVEEERKTLNVWKLAVTGEEVKLPEDDEGETDLEAQGYFLARKKKVKIRRIHKYIMSGDRIIEDCGRIAGKYIPIIPFYGKRAFIDNVERIQGHVRLTTDLMRLYNMLISLLAEISVYSPIEKPILTPEQIQNHEKTWAEDNIKRNPYLLLNPIVNPDGSSTPVGPIGYTKPPAIPASMAALMQLCNIDMQELLGSQGGAEEVVSNISAKAVELIQTRLDMQTFIYMDNFSKAVRQSGKVWLSMAQEIIDEEGRKLKTLGVDGSEDEITLLQPMQDAQGKAYQAFDLTKGRYGVYADVGPSFTTRRDGTVRALSGLLQYTQDPQERAALTGVIFQNIDGEGLQDLKDWNRKRLVAMGVIKPTDAEKEQMQKEAEAQAGQPPSAQDAFLIAEAEKSRNLAQKAQAETLQTLEEVKQTKAETEKTLAQAQEIIKKMGLLDMDTLLRLVEMNRSAPAAAAAEIPAIEMPPVAPPEQTQVAQ
jgi:hypothetical protein